MKRKLEISKDRPGRTWGLMEVERDPEGRTGDDLCLQPSRLRDTLGCH